MSGQMVALAVAHRCHWYVTVGLGNPAMVVFAVRRLPTAAALVFVAPPICSDVSAGAARTCAVAAEVCGADCGGVVFLAIAVTLKLKPPSAAVTACVGPVASVTSLQSPLPSHRDHW